MKILRDISVGVYAKIIMTTLSSLKQICSMTLSRILMPTFLCRTLEVQLVQATVVPFSLADNLVLPTETDTLHRPSS